MIAELEAMAEAIYRRDWQLGIGEDPPCAFALAPAGERQQYHELARAALEALRQVESRLTAPERAKADFRDWQRIQAEQAP